MNQQTRHNPTLFDLLGRCWQRPAPVASLAFDRQGGSVAFATLDGTIALAPVAEAEGPEGRIRISSDLGQMRILPRTKPPAPLTALMLREGETPLVVPFHQGGFLVATGEGAVKRVSAQGELTDDLYRLGRPILALDHAMQSGVTAVSDSEELCLLDQAAAVIARARPSHPAMTLLKFSPDGRLLAGLSDDKLVIMARDEDLSVQSSVTLPSLPTCLHWSARADRIACGLMVGGFSLVDVPLSRTDTVLDFPAPVHGLGWGAGGELVASGAYRIAAWRMGQGAAREALVTGPSGLILVEAVAPHPKRDLIAAGYADGRIVVARLGARDELLVRAFGGKITALAWSPDGQHLAVGDAEGQAALITFPPQLFK